jgi:hypothetical protein
MDPSATVETSLGKDAGAVIGDAGPLRHCRWLHGWFGYPVFG